MGMPWRDWRSPMAFSFALSCAVGLGGCGGQPPQAQTPTGVPVTLETLDPTLLATTTEYVGVLEADNLVTLKPEVAGIVQAIQVQEGDNVSAGTPILTLKSERSQASVQQAIAGVEAARAAQTNAEAQLSAVNAEKLEAQAELKLREQDLQRIKSLVDTGALPQRDLDQSQRDLEVAKARLNTINQRIRAAQASVSQAQATLRQSSNTVAIANEDLRETQITAPVAGIIGDLAIQQGDYLDQGETIATIAQNTRLSLNFFVPIEQAPNLRLTLPVELIDYRTLETVGRGQVSFISPEVDFTSQTILAKASFDNPDNRLFTGQLVKAKLILSQQTGVSVPVTAVSRIGAETFIFVAEPNPNAQGENDPPLIAVQKSVTLGAIEGDRYQVIEGLSTGEQVITTGILNLTDGIPIFPQEGEVFQ
ncbi:efflux RND transporter periplasmic adaptor subunit [Synechococcus moorigangaii CMS01]|nr:efflux RND transporter periplasmic adaptor subunit [Synechococcus moorigangaii CMS01]